MSSSAYLTAVAWAIERLTGDATLTVAVADRIFEGDAPAGTAYPLVLIQPYTDPDDTNFNNTRALTQVELMVRVWGSSPASHGSSYAAIEPIAVAMDDALTTGAPVTTARGYVAGCVREAESPVTDSQGASSGGAAATVLRGLGGRYTVTVSV